MIDNYESILHDYLLTPYLFGIKLNAKFLTQQYNSNPIEICL